MYGNRLALKAKPDNSAMSPACAPNASASGGVLASAVYWHRFEGCFFYREYSWNLSDVAVWHLFGITVSRCTEWGIHRTSLVGCSKSIDSPICMGTSWCATFSKLYFDAWLKWIIITIRRVDKHQRTTNVAAFVCITLSCILKEYCSQNKLLLLRLVCDKWTWHSSWAVPQESSFFHTTKSVVFSWQLAPAEWR